jgi:curved DNA-binding protein CbpA
MANDRDYRQFINTLTNISKLLQLDTNSQLQQDINGICDYLGNSNFRIGVFGPFNHGKSTLLNAMLGSKTLPIDLIPTTGAAIRVKYGVDIRTRIHLADGTEIYRSGTDILKQFAILDGDRQMRKDVVSVELSYPHPFLETGIEFLDLPGTNDREAQDNLVRQQLLGTDLVVQLLDARKLMTLGERENLRDWLLDRGIKTVVFVVNFLNLLEPEEQKEVQNRLRFVAESFRADLPPGYSNLYRVDALPALRARLKGDVAAANINGLLEFETALQNIALILQQNRQVFGVPRIEIVTRKVQELLIAKITPLKLEVDKNKQKNQTANEIKKQVEKLIQQGFNGSCQQLREFLAIENLRTKYQSEMATALARENFASWEEGVLKSDLRELQQAIENWLYQAYDFFKQQQPQALGIDFPQHPQITLPPRNENMGELSEPGSVAVGSGIGWLIGGPLGAAVLGGISYLANQKIQEQEQKSSIDSYARQVAQIYLDAVDKYLQDLSRLGFSSLTNYEFASQGVIKFLETVEFDNSNTSEIQKELSKWQASLYELNQQLVNNFGIGIPVEFHVELSKNNFNFEDNDSSDIPVGSGCRHRVNNYQNNFHTNSASHNANQNSVYRSQGVGYREEINIPKAETKQIPKAETKQQENKTQTANTANSNNHFSSNYSIPNFSYSQTNYQQSFEFNKVDKKFRDWELDEEITQMKSEMEIPCDRKQQTHQFSNPNPQKSSENIANAYKKLGLVNTASIEEIKQAYKKLVKQWHPDLYINQPQQLKQAQEKMRIINDAYNLLSD